MYIRTLLFAVLAAALLPAVAIAQSASFNPASGAILNLGDSIVVTNNLAFDAVIQLKKADGTPIGAPIPLAAGPGTSETITIPNDPALKGITIIVDVSYPGGQPGATATYSIQ